ncbi:GerMN domain-containing protein [Nesterenkonia natronophila]|uniref:Uncharacterized protein n=1 Tax=Nesterenkonia natronophila TaxID=2174932 RepID=A0A3A4FK36_9MICC|nr:GerMN domain-containing protein [Nesterenkonia natronophila]RJN32765.1 hypothetical protein D3250_02790 [Nesterenkonia natronophila]
MTSGPSLRVAVSAFAVLALLGVSACDGDSADNESDTESKEGNQDTAEQDPPDDPLPEPAFDDDETVSLPIGLVSPPGYDWEIYESDDEYRPDQPHSHQVARTNMFGCQDYISVMQTVPIVTEDPTTSALEYLLAMDTSQHGDPAFLNPLASSGLEVTGAEHDGDVVTVSLTGSAGSTSICQSWQILKQIEATARAATGAPEAEVLLDEAPLSAQLGLEETSPLTIQNLD